VDVTGSQSCLDGTSDVEPCGSATRGFVTFDILQLPPCFNVCVDTEY